MLIHCIGESIPLFFWVTAEPAISIVCACLPAMLPLGRHLAHRYMEPVWSSVTSRYGSRVALKSKSGNFSSGRDPYGTERSKHDDAPPPEDTPAGFEGRQSGDSRRNILGLSSTENAYHADARGGLPSDSDDLIFPLQSIRVENEIRVSTRANSNAG
jgi:hypothetical protein